MNKLHDIFLDNLKNIFFILNSKTLEQLELSSAFSIHQNNLYSQTLQFLPLILENKDFTGIHKGIK